MCLIAYIPAGKKLPVEHVKSAYRGNDDGIGIMSVYGVERFLGNKALKRALKYLETLHSIDAEYAIHFRYATHGEVSIANTHPFTLPNGAAWVMHNGVLSKWTDKATKLHSDTSVFVRERLLNAPDTGELNLDYWTVIAGEIGTNKLCVMTKLGHFIIVNKAYGTMRDGIWYSQTYSLPHEPHVYSTPTHRTPYRPSGYYDNVAKRWVDYTKEEMDERDRLEGALKRETTNWQDRYYGRDAGTSRNGAWFESMKAKQEAARLEAGTLPSNNRTLTTIAGNVLTLTHDDPTIRAINRRYTDRERISERASRQLDEIAAEQERIASGDAQLDQALIAHLSRLDGEADGGLTAVLEIDTRQTARDNCELPGWSEIKNAEGST